MDILLNIFLFALGLGILYFGADALVRGSSSVAASLGVRPIIVGMTVIAFGTSAPEFFVSFIAAFNGSTDIAIGNVVGSNIANVGLVLGVSAVFVPFAVPWESVKRELVISLFAAVLFTILVLDGAVTFTDGLILFSGIIIFTTYCISIEKKQMKKNRDAKVVLPAGKYPLPVSALLTIAGLAGLVGGAHLMTNSAVFIAHRAGVSELVIGMTIVAIGTSLPELGASLMSIFKGENELGVGNVLGSNIFNVFMVIGGTAIFFPLPVEAATLKFQFPVMIAFSLVLIPLVMVYRRMGRLTGFALATGYAAFLLLSFIRS